MLIICDLEIRDFDYFHNLHLEELSLILDIKEFVYLKIEKLKEDVELEELFSERAFTVIYILPGMKNGQVEFMYSGELTKKLEACFSIEDWRQLAEMVAGK